MIMGTVWSFHPDWAQFNEDITENVPFLEKKHLLVRWWLQQRRLKDISKNVHDWEEWLR